MSRKSSCDVHSEKDPRDAQRLVQKSHEDWPTNCSFSAGHHWVESSRAFEGMTRHQQRPRQDMDSPSPHEVQGTLTVRLREKARGVVDVGVVLWHSWSAQFAPFRIQFTAECHRGSAKTGPGRGRTEPPRRVRRLSFVTARPVAGLSFERSSGSRPRRAGCRRSTRTGGGG